MDDRKRICACVADDAITCWQLRYPEVEEADGYQEQCMCPCHDEFERDLNCDEVPR